MGSGLISRCGRGGRGAFCFCWMLEEEDWMLEEEEDDISIITLKKILP